MSDDDDDKAGHGEGEQEDDTIGEYIGERNILKERHGQGYAYFVNQDQYQGQYRHNQRHGYGLYVFRNGARYLGNYRCNLKHGMGTFYYPNGSIYRGEWRKDMKHGHGVYTYPNGDIYEGSWFKNKRHGIGKYIFKESDCTFNGTWKDGIRMGAAHVIYKNHRLHCTWNNENPEGPAAYTFDCHNMSLGYFTLVPLDDIGDTGVVSKDNEIVEQKFHPLWQCQTVEKYDYAKLPPDPISWPIDVSEDECISTPPESLLEMLGYELYGGGEEEEEADEEGIGNEQEYVETDNGEPVI